ncbi:MAG: acyl-CoA thioesterase [Peptococcaceae bacterium]|nr:acyl-CoA thioesterase [Peptococcaceae bacterium]
MFSLTDRDNAVCRLELEVGWGDVDAAGIVYYVKYFDWFSDGRVALLKQVNMPYSSCFHGQGINMAAVEAYCRYRRPLKLEERFTLHTRLTKLERARMTFEYKITRLEDGEVAVEGRTVHAYVDGTGKPFDVKKKFPRLWDELCRRFSPPEG